MLERVRPALLGAIVVTGIGAAAWFLFGESGDAPSATPDGKSAVAGDQAAPASTSENRAAFEIRAGLVTTATASRPAKAVRPRGRGLITGWVDYVDGGSADGATVTAMALPYEGRTLRGATPAILSTQTDDAGYFVFESLPDAPYLLRATDGTLTGTAAVPLRDGAKEEATLILADGGVLNGIVVDETDTPIAGATVTPAKAAVPNGRVVPVDDTLSATSDSQGRFRIEGVAHGPLVLLARAEGFADAATEQIEVDAENIVIVLGAKGELAGQTIDANTGVAVAGVRVVAFAADYALPGVEAVSGEDGRFRFAALRPAPYFIVVRDETYTDAEPGRTVSVEARKKTTTTVRVGAAGAISGRAIIRTKNIPAPDIRLRAYLQRAPEGAKAFYEADHLLDQDGAFRIGGLSPGHYDILAADGAGLVDSKPVQVMVGLGQVRDTIEVAMVEGGTIRGHVFDANGDPQAGAIVAVRNDYNDDARAVTGADGSYRIEGVATFDRTWVRAEYRATQSPHVYIRFGGKGDVVVDLALTIADTGSIAGTVVDAAGRPTRARMNSTVELDGGAIHPETAAGEDGRFVFRRLPPGPYTVRAFATGVPGNAYITDPIVVAPGQQVDGLRITLSKAPTGTATITGTVVDAEGRPIAGAAVRGGPAAAISGPHGAFRLTGLPESEFDITGYHRDKGSGRETVTAGADNVRLRLEPPKLLRGRVVDASTGAPITAFHLAVNDSLTNIERVLPKMIAYADSDGRFEAPFPY